MVVFEIASLTDTLGVELTLGVFALCCKLETALAVVAISAHSARIVSLVGMLARGNLTAVLYNCLRLG